MKITATRTIRFTVFIGVVGALLFGCYRLAMGQSAQLKKKHINVLTIHLSDLDIPEAVRLEDSIGHQLVTPFLKSKGFEVENSMSMHRLVVANEGLEGFLIKAFEKEPDRDSARILIVTLSSRPGTEPFTVRTDFVLLDVAISGLIAARQKGIDAKMETIWTYETNLANGPPIESVDALPGKVSQGLLQFCDEYQNTRRI